MRRVIAVAALMVLLAPATAHAAGPLNPAKVLGSAQLNVATWCLTHFRNPALTVFIACNPLFGLAEFVGQPTSQRVRMRQTLQGDTSIACSAGCAGPGWEAHRRLVVFIDPRTNRRRRVRGVWRCIPHGALGPAAFTGVRCFFPPDPRNPS
jgi:hypothetical protein